MTTLSLFWLPILVSTVLVFIASSLVWMVLPHHRSDTRGLPDEAPALDALGKQGLTPGIYRFPFSADMKAMNEPAFVAKMEKGPVGLLTVRPSGRMNMGPQMGIWTFYVLVISTMVAYVGGKVLAPGTPFIQVFRVVGTVAALAYAGGVAPNAIWWGKPWSNAWKEIADGIAYGLLTGLVFAWLWPR